MGLVVVAILVGMLLVTIVIIVRKKKNTKDSKQYVMLTENLVLENVVYDGLRCVNSTHATDNPVYKGIKGVH